MTTTEAKTISFSRDDLEPMLRAAYLRGAEWHRINGMDIVGYIAKAAGDYADATCTVTFEDIPVSPASCFVGDFRGGEMGGICAKNPGFPWVLSPQVIPSRPMICKGFPS